MVHLRSSFRLLWLSFFLGLAGSGSLRAAITIMPLGDSITVGVDYYTGTAGGYRDPLYHDLVADNVPAFTFVGVNNSDATSTLTTTGNTYHNGYGGYEIQDLSNNLDGVAAPAGGGDGNLGGYWLTGGGGTGRGPVTPNIILLQAGANDILHGVALGTVETRISNIVTKIHTLTPNTTILLAAIPPFNNAGFNSTIQSFNSYIKNTVIPAYSYTRYVDNNSAFFNADGSVNTLLLGTDNVHPTRYGYPILAQNWARAIQAVIGGTSTAYTLSVAGGTGSGTYPAGSVVTINSNAPPSGNQFSSWTPASAAIDNPYFQIATYVMPAANTTLTANYTATGSPIIPNGTYQITDPASYQLSYFSGLSIGAASASSGALVQEQTYSSAANQQWTLTNLGNNVVELSLSGTSNALEVAGASTATSANLDIAPYTGATNQQWTITPLYGTIEIVNVNSGQAINILGYSTTPGTQLVQNTAGYSANQVWAFYPTTGGGTTTYALTVNSGSGSGNYAAGTVVSVTANAPANGYHFAGWTGATGTLANPAAATTTLTMPASATSITATYAATITTYALTVNSGSGSGTYAAGTVVNVVANTAPGGYQFAGWTGTTSALANPAAAATTLTMPAAATSITATYSVVSSLTTAYQDAFSRSGDLAGSVPSPMNTGGATWTSTTGSGEYTTNGSVVTIPASAYAYSAAFLPVNGSSGVVLDGTKNFTLSVLLTSGSTGLTGIALSTGLTNGGYGNLFTNNLATVVTSSSFLGAYSYNGGNINYNFGPGITGASTVSLAYNASAGTLTFSVGSSVLLTQSGVTASQIAALTAVALGNDGYGSNAAAPAPTFDNFTLAIGTGGGTTYALTVNSGSGSGNYAAGTAVSVTANAPASGYQFSGWSGATSTLANPSAATTTLTMPAAATSITATYAPITATYALTVNSGSGSGNYAAGTAVTVTANAAPSGYQFSGWSGATSALANPAAASTTLTMPAAATSITANYSLVSSNTTVYQDAFSRSGELVGTTPNPTDAGGATWSSTTGTGQYTLTGSVVTIPSSAYAYSAAFLPVNGSSGVVLDGTKNFTLSVLVTPGSAGLTGIALSTGLTSSSYGNLFTNNLATVVTCSGFLGAYSYNGGSINYNYGPGITGATTVSLAYNASAGTLTFSVGSSVLLTQTGVTTSQIAALRAVAFGNDGYGSNAAAPAPTFDNFTLTVSQ